MEPKRWQEIEQLCLLALERKEDERQAFLLRACGDDDALRWEVESLLAESTGAEAFIESPAFEIAARLLAEDQKEEIEDDWTGRYLSHYRIVEKLGSGGMGVVYRAVDENLDRKVAVKVLPRTFGGDPERLARLEREARLMAAVSHPNVAAVYGFEITDGQHYLLLELVEGATLAEILGERSLSFREGLEICSQIARGTEAAHDEGIVHRDLKPANVKITGDGIVKVLDFGLAKALQDSSEAPGAAMSPAITNSIVPGGLILGTASYMSPEQAKGKEADKRSDIWALGCILYECLTGRRAFQGETITETLAAVLTEEPNWALLPMHASPSIRTLIEQCLQKDPRNRLRDIRDVRLGLEHAIRIPDSRTESETERRLKWTGLKQTATWLLAAAGLAVGVGGVVMWGLRSESELKPARHFTITLPSEFPFASVSVLPGASDRPALSLSPDGAQLAYIAQIGDQTAICVRDMASGKVHRLSGTEGGHTPFFSPGGASIGFFAGGKLKVIPSTGGAARALADASNPWGASWGSDHFIYFNRFEGEGIFRVAADGGQVECVSTVPQTMPEFLGEGRGLLARSLSAGGGTAYVQGQQAPRSIVDGFGARFAPTPLGYLVYAVRGKLMAAPFDHVRMAVDGPSIPLVEGLRTGPYGVAQFTFDREGTLVYAAGRPQRLTSFVQVDRSGNVHPLGMLAERLYSTFAMSPDGRSLALTTLSETPQGGVDIWIYDLSSATMRRLTPRTPIGRPAANLWPRWTPDGRRVVFARSRDGVWQLMLASGAGGGEAIELWSSAEDGPQWLYPMSFSPDGSDLLAFGTAQSGSDDIWLLHLDQLDGPRKPQPQLFIGTPFSEFFAQVSPDGRWMLYVSDQSGIFEVYVTSFPEPGVAHLISRDGGGEPMWNPAAPEIFYMNGRRMYSVDVTLGSEFRAGEPRFLFDVPCPTVAGIDYDLTRDGRQFLMLENKDFLKTTTTLEVMTNFFDELCRRAPGHVEK